MDIKPFAVEEWMNAWEVGAKYNIAETCVDSVSLDELFELTGEDRVISIMPTYQQLYSIPESFGADVHYLKLKKEEK